MRSRGLTLREAPRYDRLKELFGGFPELDASALHTCLTLMSVATRVIGALDAKLDELGISPGRFTVLVTLYGFRPEGLTMTDLASRCAVTGATMTGLVSGLERSGLVRREAQISDRRSVVIFLTDSGLALLERVLPSHLRNVASMTASLGERDRATLVRLLERLGPSPR
jgi:DNA-binding MarR family transcriptional regulator